MDDEDMVTCEKTMSTGKIVEGPADLCQLHSLPCPAQYSPAVATMRGVQHLTCSDAQAWQSGPFIHKVYCIRMAMQGFCSQHGQGGRQQLPALLKLIEKNLIQ